MKVRNKKSKIRGFAARFNPSTMDEIIISFYDGSSSSEFAAEYEVFLYKTRKWVDLEQAFKDGRVGLSTTDVLYEQEKKEKRKW